MLNLNRSAFIKILARQVIYLLCLVKYKKKIVSFNKVGNRLHQNDFFFNLIFLIRNETIFFLNLLCYDNLVRWHQNKIDGEQLNKNIA